MIIIALVWKIGELIFILLPFRIIYALIRITIFYEVINLARRELTKKSVLLENKRWRRRLTGFRPRAHGVPWACICFSGLRFQGLEFMGYLRVQGLGYQGLMVYGV